MEEPTGRRKNLGVQHNRMRQRLLQARQVQLRAQQQQVRMWIERFDVNKSGRLEREELSALLESLHPEVGSPDSKALDLLITQATEVRTYSMHMRGDPNGAVGPNILMQVVNGYSMYVLASAAFDRHQHGGVVALRDLPYLMKEATQGSDIEGSDVDFVVDCAASSLHGLDSASAMSREELLPAFAAWQLNQLESASAGVKEEPDEEAAELAEAPAAEPPAAAASNELEGTADIDDGDRAPQLHAETADVSDGAADALPVGPRATIRPGRSRSLAGSTSAVCIVS
jgi:hypothetical protein